MSQKSTKDKLLAYLFDQAKQQGSAEFFIPCDRQALADYSGVERTAMSAGISKLKKSGTAGYQRVLVLSKTSQSEQ